MVFIDDWFLVGYCVDFFVGDELYVLFLFVLEGVELVVFFVFD